MQSLKTYTWRFYPSLSLTVSCSFLCNEPSLNRVVITEHSNHRRSVRGPAVDDSDSDEAFTIDSSRGSSDSDGTDSDSDEPLSVRAQEVRDFSYFIKLQLN